MCHRDVWPVTSLPSVPACRLRRKTELSPPDQWLFSGTLSPHETLRTSLNLFWASHSTLMLSQSTGSLPAQVCHQSHHVPQHILPACQGPHFTQLAQTTGCSDLDAWPGLPLSGWPTAFFRKIKPCPRPLREETCPAALASPFPHGWAPTPDQWWENRFTTAGSHTCKSWIPFCGRLPPSLPELNKMFNLTVLVSFTALHQREVNH